MTTLRIFMRLSLVNQTEPSCRGYETSRRSEDVTNKPGALPIPTNKVLKIKNRLSPVSTLYSFLFVFPVLVFHPFFIRILFMKLFHFFFLFGCKYSFTLCTILLLQGFELLFLLLG